jgi:ribosomal protein S18 acetylase RimI-like enzyme
MADTDKDAERFKAWQLDALAAHSDEAELLSIGPFRALVPTHNDSSGLTWATLVEGDATEAETHKALTKLKAAFKKHKAVMEIEYNEGVFPKVGKFLESAGLKMAERNPLMGLRPEAFKPFATAEVNITRLTTAATPPELEAFQKIRWTDGGEVDREVPPIERLRAELSRPYSVYLLAWCEWEPAGTGVSHALKGAAEIVGVVTRKDRRKRGVAAAVTSDLVSRHFGAGGEFVFLDAANEEAARVYERLGFKRFGANLIYRG